MYRSLTCLSDLKHEMEELKAGFNRDVWSDWIGSRFVMSILNETGFKRICFQLPYIKAKPQRASCRNSMTGVSWFTDVAPLSDCRPPSVQSIRGKHCVVYKRFFKQHAGFRLRRPAGFLKLLAVHCGLARYGRNNISYSNEFGSHMRLLAYVRFAL